MTDNPFQHPLVDDRWEPPPKRLRIPKSRSEIAGQLSIFGFVGGAMVGTVGFLVLIAAIELLLTPPFKSPPNYGQFGIIVIGVGFYAALFGVCLGIVPYVTWLGYIPVHLLGLWLIWSIDKQFFAEVDWTEAPIVAMFAILALPTPVAVCVDYWANRYPRIPQSG
jgi:hypothetical protein